MKSPAILITGGLGYVGSRLAEALIRDGEGPIRVVDLLLFGEESLNYFERHYPGQLEAVRADVREPRAMLEAAQGIGTVVHLAAISNDPTGNIDEVLTRQVNFEGTATVLISARRAGVRRFINASSSSIFGASACACVGETAEPEPLTAYSRTKHLAEWVVRAAHSSGFTTVNVRPATICGVSPRQRLDLLVNQLAADAVTRGCITVQGGDQRRPHVTMTDIVRFYRLMMTAPEEAVGGRTFNVAFETETVRETAERIQAIFGRDRVKLEYTAVKDARDYHVDGELIRRRFQFAPVSSIRQEVLELEQAIRSGRVDPQDARHYNLRGELPRRNAAANHIEEAAYEPLPEAQR